jgi:DNA-binding transcriptional LysR family regulator
MKTAAAIRTTILYAHALLMEEQATVAFRKVSARDDKPMGTVRVATVDDMAVHIIAPIVASFRQKHPNVIIDIDVRQNSG